MKRRMQFNRREFVKGIGYASAVGACSGLVPGFAAAKAASFARSVSGASYAYVGSVAEDNHGIHVFTVNGDRWEQKQYVSSKSPSCLLLHPDQEILYVANEVDEYQGRPCGTVESYSIDPHDGSLTLVHTQRLSLSGIMPRQLALSHDRKYLVAALYGGGAYNLLALKKNGVPESVTGIVKDVGSGMHPEYQCSSHPSSICLDPIGKHFLSTDLGKDQINVFAIETGRLVRKQQLPVAEGSGPGHLQLHPSGRFLYLANQLDGSISCYRYQSDSGTVGSKIQHLVRAMHSCSKVDSQNSLVVHPSGRFLYSSFKTTDNKSTDGIRAWELHPSSGKAFPLATFLERSVSSHGLVLSTTGDRLYVLDRNTSAVYGILVDSVTGNLALLGRMAQVGAPASLAFKYLRS